MKKVAVIAGFAAVALVGGAICYAALAAPAAKVAPGGETRTDCPGKIVCPLTGEEICMDRCPLNCCESE